jgi:hypothetical protein
MSERCRSFACHHSETQRRDLRQTYAIKALLFRAEMVARERAPVAVWVWGLFRGACQRDRHADWARLQRD